MIAVAGYLNFTQDNIEKYTEVENQQNVDGTDENDLYNLSDEDAGLEDLNVLAEDEDSLLEISEEDLENKKVSTVSDGGEIVSVDDDEETIGESVLVSNTIQESYFATAKLKREQTRAKNTETLMKLAESMKTTDEQKQEATNEILKLTSAAERESSTEIALEAKGFNGVLVSIINDKVEVIMNANDLTEQQMAQIEEIVKRKTEIEAQNIVITPVGVTAKE